MNQRRLLISSLTFYRRANLGVVLGTMLATLVLTGALLVGDSVRYTLRHMAEARLGGVTHVLSAGDRFMRTALADELSQVIDGTATPVLQLAGVGSADGGQRRTGRIQVLGVDARFWAMAGISDRTAGLGYDGVVINTALAEQLKLSVGDQWLLRLESQEWVPGDLPFAARESRTRSLRLTVSAIVARDSLGIFGLEPHQRDPLNCYLPLTRLGEEVERSSRVNTLLVSSRQNELELGERLNTVFQLADAELYLRQTSGDIELNSLRVFLDHTVEAAAASHHPQKLLTYFVNRITSAGKSTPYSFVAGVESEGLGDDEIRLSDWLARDLSARRGDAVDLHFWLPEAAQALTEHSQSFTVKSITPLRGTQAERDLTPAFPGLTDVDNCRDWDPAIPINLDDIRDKDEKYWEDFASIPKARISVNTARQLWSSRFGALTALRFPQSQWTESQLESALLEEINPASLGFVFRDVRAQAMNASGQAIDFGQLFLGLSFFLMLAALILAALLFILGIEQRSTEMGTLRALGFTPKAIRRQLMAEGLILGGIGAILGVVLGILYNQLTLTALATFWIGAVGTRHLIAHVTPVSLFIGGVAGWLTTILAMRFTIRRQGQKTIRDLQQQSEATKTNGHAWMLWAGLLLVLAAMAVALLIHPAQDRNAAGAFWGAGAAMLAGSLLLVHVQFRHLREDRGLWQIDMAKLGRRATARKTGRSTAAVALLALGVFITVAVGANRRSTLKNAAERSSGTGGFALYAETTLPIRENVNDVAGRAALGLESGRDDDVQLLPLRLRQGADASCLNLNHIARPKVMGINPQQLSDRNAFSFAEVLPELEGSDVWAALNDKTPAGVIPAVADQTVIVWGLQKAVGDTLLYTNEAGQPVRIRLVAGLVSSIFQGGILISQKHFAQAFPSVSGTRVLLVDAPAEKNEALQRLLSRTLANLGTEVETTSERLARFLVIENTYLSIFLALGGLALVVGTLGLGVLIFRNVMERRGELALLRAVGYDRRDIEHLLISENLSIFLSGTAIGTVSAMVAVLPALMAPGATIPWLSMTLTLAAILLTGLIWIFGASRLALREDLMPALRNE